MTPSKPCSSCGFVWPVDADHWHRNRTKPDGFATVCKDCANEQKRASYWRDPERARHAQTSWRQKNPEKMGAMWRAYREKHHETILDRDRRRHAKNGRERGLRYREKHRPEIRERNRRWYEANREAVNARRREKRRRKREGGDG
jgi:hypothetical protein